MKSKFKLKIGAVIAAGLFVTSQSYGQEYAGSSFSEVWDVVRDVNSSAKSDVEEQERAVYSRGKLPQYPVNAASVFAGGSQPLERDAKRTVNERWDYYDRLPKRLHPNGVCVAGEWKITAKTNYSGQLATGAKGLFVGRVSVAMEDTTSKKKRGFGIAGKVFSTNDPFEKVKSANFFTVDVLLGSKLRRVLDSSPTNEPETGFDLSLIGLGIKIASALTTADENPGFRPLTQVAAAGADSGEIVQPKWIRLQADQKLVRNNETDFRTEVLQALKENKTLRYFIDVSDTTKDRNANAGWTRIGEINLDQAVVSYGCDRRLHFAHPKLK